MDWLSSIDLSHLWDVIVAQTPTPTPTPSPTSTPVRNLSEIELLKNQFKEIDNLVARVDYYYVSANTSVTLMGIVADAAYVAYGEKNEG